MFHGKWIWENNANKCDEHAEFYTTFEAEQNDEIIVKISADTDYMLFVNGILAAFSQYPDYPGYKVYDEIDISEFVNAGKNHFAVEAYHSGEISSTHYATQSGIIFDVYKNGVVLISSGNHIESRLSNTYINYMEKKVSSQLGFAYSCDLTRCDNWHPGGGKGFHPSTEVFGLPNEFVKRAIKKLEILPVKKADLIKQKANSFIYDLGCEEVGFPDFKVLCKNKCNVKLSWAEHISSGDVISRIHDRDFSIDFALPAGESAFFSTFLRIGGRYLKLESNDEIEVIYCSLRPVVYPLRKSEFRLENPLRQRIYDTAVRTLELCMHEHYEDCPWREQAMYAMDSRNQMLCGYFAFNEFDFARASLELMCNDPTDGLMSICFPCNIELKIPSFSLHWFTQMKEYLMYSDDKSLCEKYHSKMENVLNIFLSRMETGLVPVFYEDKNFWNFYEWTDKMDGSATQHGVKSFDLALNCLVSNAMQSMEYINNKLGYVNKYAEKINELNSAIAKNFFDECENLFTDIKGEKHFSQLGNSLAVLCGAANKMQSEKVCEKLIEKSKNIVPSSLSMLTFVYDALIATDKARYSEFILKDIDEKYAYMLSKGATSFWETLDGERDFDGAGSLCHGWSAMPVYYYNILKA